MYIDYLGLNTNLPIINIEKIKGSIFLVQKCFTAMFL